MIKLDPGIYVNTFHVHLSQEEIDVMVSERKKFQNLKELKEEITGIGKSIYLYAPPRTGKVYGYGKHMDWLVSRGFKKIHGFNINSEPALTGRMILEGVIKKAEDLQYVASFGKEKGRVFLFNWSKFKETSDRQVKVFTGYDIRVIFLKDLIEGSLEFGIIVDVKYSLKSANGRRLNYHEIVSNFGNDTLRKVRQIQKDLVTTGINTEVSRQRLLDDIIPFVEKIRKIELPCGVNAEITTIPSRIVVGEKNEFAW